MLEKQRESEFSEWDDLKYGLGLPLLFILLIASVIGLFVSLWGSLR